MSAASSERPSPTVNISAFIMLHGSIILHRESGNESVPEPDSTKTNNYRLNVGLLPEHTELYAPGILGYTYAYYHNLSKYIREIHSYYINNKDRVEGGYIKFFVESINKYEKDFASAIQSGILDSRNMTHSPEYERALGLRLREQAVKKSRVKWVKHTNYIQEKRYSIVDRENYIMLFCGQELVTSDKTPDEISDEIKKIKENIVKFNNQNPTYQYGTSQPVIKYAVIYDDKSHICLIKFHVDQAARLVHLFHIMNIINNVLSNIFVGSNYYLSIFDFSCSKIKFLLLPDDTEADFISSQKTSQPYPATLVYETISPDTAKEIDRRKSGRLPWAEPGSPTPREVMSPFPLPKSPFSKPVSPSYLQWSHKPWGAPSFADFSHGNGAAAEDPLSPARPANDILTVQVPSELVTFVDFGFEVIDKFYTPQTRARSRSPSPTSGQGGSRHSHRRTRRHTRVGKKVSLRHGHRRRRRGTKARSRRNTRKRETKN